jgi:hypothetical protein
LKKPIKLSNVGELESVANEIRKHPIDNENTNVAPSVKSSEGSGFNMKASLLYFDSKGLARLVNREIKDGSVDLEDKAWQIDPEPPMLLKKGLGFRPFYIVSWRSVFPAISYQSPNNATSDKKVLTLTPVFKDTKEITPEMYKKTMKLKILGNMLKVKKETPSWTFLIIGAVFGAFVLYFLIASKFLKI